MREVILLPAYNEEKNISNVLEEVKKFFPKSKIVVVDDGSKDKTSDIAKKYTKYVVVHKKNKGKAEALKTGIKFILKKFPNTKYILITDSDGQYSIKDGKRLLKKIEKEKLDFVMGARNWKTVPFRHRLGNFVWRTTFNLLFGTKFKDTNCGYMAMNLKTARELIPRIYGGYILENSILIYIVKNNKKIKQVPVRVFYKKVSGIKRGIRMVLGVLIFIIKEGLKYRFGK